jgi:aromatic-L-amino-acid decarboxylase
MSDARDIPIEDFQRAGARAMEWISSYLTDPERYPVRAQSEPGELKAALADSAPLEGESLDAILDDFEKIIVPHNTHWNHPCFFAYFSVSGSVPGILGELLSATLNVNGMLWQTSPAATELEEVTLEWLRKLLGLPAVFEGVIMDTASVSSLCAVAAARHSLSDLEIRERGMSGRPDLPLLRLYTSDQAHSSIDKAAIVLGLGKQGVRHIASDESFRMDVVALEAAIKEDRAAGFRPFCVVATVGTTSTTSVDPVPAIAAVCKREGLWLHVDAAYAGSAAVIPEYRHVLDGCGGAASIVVNPHKWLFTPIDCSVLYVRDPETLTEAFSLVPEYLRTSQSSATKNYMDWGVSLGRRFRALKLWMVLRAFGADGIAQRLKEHIRLAHLFAGWVDEHPEFERLAPTPLSVVCFRARPARFAALSEGEREAALDEFNEDLLSRLNAGGAIYLSHTKLNGRYTLRLAIGNIRTTEKHVATAWELIGKESEKLAADG